MSGSFMLDSLLLLLQVVFGKSALHIKNASEFIKFANSVTAATNFEGSTIFLDSDLDFSGNLSEQFDPIKYFKGVFDGQGNVISGLVIDTDSQYVGVFGTSKGLTISNVVIDSTCSVYCSHFSTYTYAVVGGVVGHCGGEACTIKNTVSMAGVTFTGFMQNDSLYLGGIVGKLSTDEAEAMLKNCANYGSVMHFGLAGGHSYIGGIVGDSTGESLKSIQNCVNYGKIAHYGTSYSTLHIGGILGCAWSKVDIIENCISAGGVIISSSGSRYIGNIVGYSDSKFVTMIRHCFWTSNMGYNASGGGAPVVDLGSSEIIANSTAVGSLNDYSESKNWNRWLLNMNNNTVTFKINKGGGFSFASQLILGPSPIESEKFKFSGWYTNENYTEKFSSTEVICNTTLYGKYLKSTHSRASAAGLFVLLAFGVIIIFVLPVVVFLLCRKNGFRKRGCFLFSKKKYTTLKKPLINISNRFRVDTLLENEVNGENVTYKALVPFFYMSTKPTMKKALLDAGLTEEMADNVVKKCIDIAASVKAKGNLFEGFTEEDAAAIAMYTYDSGIIDNNPYRIINRSLTEKNLNSLQKASGILYLVMTALRKLPRVTGTTLYRGLRSGVEMDEDNYCEGKIVTWPALSSTSPDMKATKTFLAKGSKTGKATGTLFIIEDGWGYDIQPYSMFPDEAEILLEPERKFKVLSVIPSDGVNIINLKMLDTPPILTQIFGEVGSIIIF